MSFAEVTVSFIQTYTIPVDLDTIQEKVNGEAGTVDESWVKRRIDDYIADGEAEGIKHGAFGEPKDPLGEWDVDIDVHPVCDKHRDERLIAGVCWVCRREEEGRPGPTG